MDQLLRLKQPVGVGNFMLIRNDPAEERALRSLVPPSEICPEENRSRLENRRFSDVFPLAQVTTGDYINERCLFDFHDPMNRGLVYSARTRPASRDIASAPPPGNTGTINTLHTLRRQSALDKLNSPTTYPSLNTSSAALSIPQPLINTTVGGNTSIMAGSRIPRWPKPQPLASDVAACNPPAPSYVPREDSSSSLVPLKDSDKSTRTADKSIRIVKPDFTLSPLNLKDMGSKKHVVEGSRSRSKTMNEHSRSHPRSVSQHKQASDAPQGHGGSRDRGAGTFVAKPDPSTQNGNVRSESTDRGRTMQRRYEFIDSDDKTHTILSPVQEKGMTDNTNVNANADDGGEGMANVGRESNMTTMTDLIRQGAEPSPPELPPRRGHRQQATEVAGTLAKQPVLPQQKIKRRPHPLNLQDPIYLGRVRHAKHYEVKHIAIKSSKAEFFDLSGPQAISPTFDGIVEHSPRIPPLDIPSLDGIRGMDPLELYDQWRKSLKHDRTASQGSVHVVDPTLEEATIRDGEQIVQNRPIVSHARSRSSLGIREDRDREQRHRQFSDDPVYSPSIYSATPLGPGPGIARSATVHDVPHRDHQLSNGSGPTAGWYGVPLNNVPMGAEMGQLSSPFTPLTPFIMRASGAPDGVERGSKTLFGERGWLENTAAAGTTKPKMEKMGNFMENLKRKARELADSKSFKPARNSRTNTVNRMKISLNAREQSLLYCELEYNLNNALDAYLKAQLNGGRLDAGKLSRIADSWVQKGRPKVVSFRYDIETQVDLITAHTETFRFYGPLQAEGPAAITGLLQAMKTNARYMRIRTFCQPDSVIAKHVLDAQNFMRLLGSPESLQRSLEEVAQFFKVAVNRYKVESEMPAYRLGGDRVTSDADSRIISNGSGQRVRFQDENAERAHHRAEMSATSQSRTDQRDRQRRDLHQQRP